jgi:hypothetical protein
MKEGRGRNGPAFCAFFWGEKQGVAVVCGYEKILGRFC